MISPSLKTIHIHLKVALMAPPPLVNIIKVDPYTLSLASHPNLSNFYPQAHGGKISMVRQPVFWKMTLRNINFNNKII